MSAQERVAGLIVARGRLVTATIRMIAEMRALTCAIEAPSAEPIDVELWSECVAQLDAQDDAFADAVTGIRALPRLEVES